MKNKLKPTYTVKEFIENKETDPFYVEFSELTNDEVLAFFQQNDHKRKDVKRMKPPERQCV